MLKRVTALLLVMIFAFTLAACGEDKGNTSSGAANNTSDVASVDSTGDNTASTGDASKDTKSTGSKATKSGTQTTASKGTTVNANSRVVTSKGGTTTQTSGQGNQSGKKNIKSVAGWISVKSGKSQTSGLNLKGKTIKMAITEEGQYNTASFKRTIAAFEKEYNCKVKLTTLKFDRYNQQVTQALSAGNMYDICYAHGSMFPACAIDNLYEDVLPTLRQDDLMDGNKPLAGGIDIAKSGYFAYKGKLYGTCNFESVFPYVIYYNKKQMADAGYSGSKDPRKLAENNKWSWSVIKSMGRRLTDIDSGVYFVSNSFTGRCVTLAYGSAIVKAETNNKTKSVKYTQNITSAQFIAGCKQIQEFFTGNTRIGEPRDGSHPYNSSEALRKGTVYMWTEETSKYLDLAKEVKSSAAFNRDKNNIGIVEVPLGSTNKSKIYPTGWLTAVCCGKGKDPRVSIAWDTFRSRYQDPVQDSNAMSKTDKEYAAELLKGDICCEPGQFQTSENDVLNLVNAQVWYRIVNGDDVSKCITQTKDQITTCINTTMKGAQ